MLVANSIAAALRAGASYDSTILADSPSYFWKLAESSGTAAADSADSNGGTYQGTITLGQAGIGDGETAVLLNGTSGCVTTASSVSAGSPWSQECWFKTSSAAGGVLIALGSISGVTHFDTADHVLYIDTNGKINFRFFSGGGVGLVTTNSYNDGNWHYAAGTVNASNNMALYVDAETLTNANTGAPFLTSGWWQIGNQDASTQGWETNLGTGIFFPGSIAKPAIYSTALTPTQVSNHRGASTSVSSVRATLGVVAAQSGFRSSAI